MRRRGSTLAVHRWRLASRAGVHGPGLIGAVEHFVKALVHHQRKALAAVFGVAAQARPAGCDVLLVRLLEALGRGDGVRGLVELAAFFVAAHVQRKDHLGRKLAAFFQHGVDGVGVYVGIARHGLEFFVRVQQLVHHKLHVAQGGGVAGHRDYSWTLLVDRVDLDWGCASGVSAPYSRRMLLKPRVARSIEPGVLRNRAS